MKPHTSLLVLLVAAVALSGCLGRASPLETAARAPDGGVDAAMAVPAAATDASARALPADFHYEEWVFPDAPPACDAAKPWVCDVHYSGPFNVTGGLEGDGMMQATIHYDSPGNGVWINLVMYFSGSAAGCGSGSMTLRATGYGTVTPDTRGLVWLHGHVALVPGTTSTGLAALADLQGDADAHTNLPNAADFTATVWCI